MNRFCRLSSMLLMLAVTVETYGQQAWPIGPSVYELSRIEHLPAIQDIPNPQTASSTPGYSFPLPVQAAPIQPAPEIVPKAPADAAGSDAKGHEEPSKKTPEETLVEPIEFWGVEIWDPNPWSGSFEFGVNGSQGNSETFNLRFGAGAKRKTESTILKLKLDYKKDSQNDVETANRLFFDGREEWLFGESPWSMFAHSTFEYDEFQAFDSRVSVDTGIGYRFFHSEVTSLKGRFGSGFSREFGGPDDSYVPEAVFGLEFERQLTKRQKLTGSADYFPNWSAFGDYRINTQVNWTVLLDEAHNLSLKIGVIDRYDSTPNGAKANDLDYSAVLLWDF